MLNAFERQVIGLSSPDKRLPINANDALEPETPSKEMLEALNENEDGDSRLYIKLNQGRFLYDVAGGRWYVWKDHYWIKDTLGEAMAAVNLVIEAYGQETARQAWQRLQSVNTGRTDEAERHKKDEGCLLKRIKTLQTVSRKEKILILARTGSDSLAIRGDEWDRDLWLLACQSGVIDLRTGEIRPGHPDDYIKTVAPVEYRGLNEPAPIWERTISEIFNDAIELVLFIQRLLGYSLTGQATEHIAPMFWGLGRNGKSTLIEIISFVMGAYAGQIESEMLLTQKFGKQSGGPSPDIMSLRGKRFVHCSETESGRHFNVARLKWLSGGDTLTGRELYGKELVTFRPTHKIFLSTNHKPHANADDYAFWKRALLIPFTLSFINEPKESHEHKADPYLLEKLKTEAPGILAWLIRGCLAWQREGLNPPDSVKAATQEYQEDEDTIKHFIDDRCVAMPGLTVRAGFLYQEYREWCAEMGHSPLNGTNFGAKIKRRFNSDKDRNGIYYRDIGLIENKV